MQQNEARFKAQEAQIQAHDTLFQTIESQLGQIVNILSDRNQGALPSNTEKNPREHIKAISLRSGKLLADSEKLEKEAEKEEPDEETKEKEKKEVVATQTPDENPYKPKLPFPRRQLQHKLDKQFSKFLDILKQLHINIPFVDAIMQMPSYTTFFKEILSNRRKLEECQTVALNEECAVIL